jgi:hypothetical protein
VTPASQQARSKVLYSQKTGNIGSFVVDVDESAIFLADGAENSLIRIDVRRDQIVNKIRQEKNRR